MSYRDLKNKVLSKVAGLVLEVEKLNDKELEQERISICESCPLMDSNRRCKICTCFIDVKAAIKVNKNPDKFFRHEITHCPLGKWNDKDIANHYRVLNQENLLK